MSKRLRSNQTSGNVARHQASLLNFFNKPKQEEGRVSKRFKEEEDSDVELAIAQSLKDQVVRREEEREGEARLEDEEEVCPICLERPPRGSLEVHVNACLDGGVGSEAEGEAGGKSGFDPSSRFEQGQSNRLFSAAAAADPRTGSRSRSQTPPTSSSTGSKQVVRSRVEPEVDAKPNQGCVDRLMPSSDPISQSKGDGIAGGGGGSKQEETRTEKREESGKGSAFAVLMKSHNEKRQWALADSIEANNSKGKARTRPEARKAPFYKLLEGMPISVDAFRFGRIEGCLAYFLTHFHSDHYGGLGPNWCHGPIYCSITTANLVRTSLRVQEKWIRPLEMESPTAVMECPDVTVTCIEANHCPGSCLFLFEGPRTNSTSTRVKQPRIYRYLHCGDFRASPLHTNHPRIKGTKIDIIYLDTTYLNPRYCFPAQDQVVEACAELVRSRLPETQRKIDRIPKKEEEEEEDWRIPPDGASVKKEGWKSDQGASVMAFKGWLGIGGASTEIKVEDGEETGNRKEKVVEQEPPPPLEEEEDAYVEGVDLDLEEEDEEEAIWAFDPLGPDEEDEIKVEEEEEEEEEERGKDLGSEGGKEEVRLKKEEEEEEEESVVETKVSTEGCNWLTTRKRELDTKQQKDAESKLRGSRLLVVVGTYTIGKEKIVKAVARVMGSKVFCVDSRKYRVYEQLEDDELHSMLTRKAGEASVHVTNLFSINHQSLSDMVSQLRSKGHDFDRVIAFRPTGWTYRPPTGSDTVSPRIQDVIRWNQSRNFTSSSLHPTRDSNREITIYGVPYSEHSSFFELTAFALSTDYERIIATVNVSNPTSRSKMNRWFQKWEYEKRKRRKGIGGGGIVGKEDDSAIEILPRSETYW
ncbi:DRMBL-domain-containing protein [Violaceomyces palustris]|uniref:DRMBL-domain-containing protein n=1 Tax=Violaceomyces palustris TaxID=1673888 RepID=A0ACD0NLB9_9BASI|nr:DRMBL-domain-containing protein [Violaceomyces palustris]